MTRLLIADDHPLMLSGVLAVLRDTGYEVVAKVRDGDAALEAASNARPDILLLDVSMPGQSGVDILRTLRGRGDERPIVLLTASLADGALVEAIDLGVNGIILKEGAEETLLTCLDAVRGGGRWIEQSLLHRALDLKMGNHARDPLGPLSPREKSVAQLVARGLRNREIGRELNMSEGTVKVHLHRIYEKLGLQSRVELAMLARPAQPAN